MIRAEQVSFRYPQENRGLSPTSLVADPGGVTLVTGPSGCGKSTLARCLMGLVPHLYHGKLSGEVWLNGHRTTDVPIWQLAEKAGMVFQDPSAQMLAPSVEEEIIFGLENLGLRCEQIETRLESVLHDFGLARLRDRSPQTLSGGEQQKLALAAIMARQPEALILDEPLSMLDTTAAGDLIGYLERYAAGGKALVIFEHRREYLDDVRGLRHVTLDGKSQAVDIRHDRMSLPPQKDIRLVIERLHVHRGGHAVFQDTNLALTGGEIIAVVGRNGVGKTTLLRALAGLQKYTGTIKVITPAGDHHPDFGMVFQNPDMQLFNASVRDEILYRVPKPDLAYYRWLLNTLGLDAYENTPPLLLSEGEKKRVGLALVLMHRPAHGLLLDEPSLGQDTAHKIILMRMLRQLADSGQMVIITTHDLTLASQADHLVLLSAGGEVTADGKTGTILADQASWQRTGLSLPQWFQRTRKAEALR